MAGADGRRGDPPGATPRHHRASTSTACPHPARPSRCPARRAPRPRSSGSSSGTSTRSSRRSRVPDPIELARARRAGAAAAPRRWSAPARCPPVDQAALDGYAARADDVAAASVEAPVRLAVVGESRRGLGGPSGIGPGLALEGHRRRGAARRRRRRRARGVDRRRRGRGDRASPRPRPAATSAAPGTTSRPATSPCRSGTPIGPAQICLLAAVGRDRVLVRPRPRVAVLSAGSELVDVGTAPGARRRWSTSTATRSPPPPGTPGPRPTGRGSCPATAAGCPTCSRASCCAATWCSSPARSPAAGRHGPGGARRARRDALPRGGHAPGRGAGLRPAGPRRRAGALRARRAGGRAGLLRGVRPAGDPDDAGQAAAVPPHGAGGRRASSCSRRWATGSTCTAWSCAHPDGGYVVEPVGGDRGAAGRARPGRTA